MEVAAAMAVPFPEDVILEILVHVKDVPSLFRCATACKRWRRLIRDPSFLRQRWPDPDFSSSLIGFCTQQQQWPDPSVPYWETCFVPTQRSPLHLARLAISSLATTATAGLFGRAVPLVSRHNLLLVHLKKQPKSSLLIVHPENPATVQLAVCNLLAGTCDILPPLKFPRVFESYQYNGYAILTSVDCRSTDERLLPTATSSFFKVALVTFERDDLNYSLFTFSSDEGSWRVRNNCFEGTFRSDRYRSFGDAVVREGTTHWLYHYGGHMGFYLMNLNAQTDNLSLTKLPFLDYDRLAGYRSYTLGLNGVLSIICLLKYRHQLEIWSQQNKGGTSEWRCTRTVELKHHPKDIRETKEWVLREKCGTILICDRGGLIYTPNFETRTMEEVVVHWPWRALSSWDATPLDIDWPTIFVSRLTRYMYVFFFAKYAG
ncbi:unnamed protein product [Alopecurus aequalis]